MVNYLKEDFKILGLKNQRAKSLQDRAKIIIEYYDGVLPSTTKDIRFVIDPDNKKPYRHMYIVEALALYVNQKPTLPVDINIARIFSRLFNITINVNQVQDNKTFCNYVQQFLPDAEYTEFNLALLDLGGILCRSENDKRRKSKVIKKKSKSPHCYLCPLREMCSFASKRVDL